VTVSLVVVDADVEVGEASAVSEAVVVVVEAAAAREVERQRALHLQHLPQEATLSKPSSRMRRACEAAALRLETEQNFLVFIRGTMAPRHCFDIPAYCIASEH
jgi:hypothetical protein